MAKKPSKPLSLAEVQAEFDKNREFVDEPVEGFGVIRFVALSAEDGIEALAKFATIVQLQQAATESIEVGEDGKTTDSGTASDAKFDLMRGVAKVSREIIALGAVDADFNPLFQCDSGQALLAKFDMDTLATMRKALMVFNGLIQPDADPTNAKPDAEDISTEPGNS